MYNLLFVASLIQFQPGDEAYLILNDSVIAVKVVHPQPFRRNLDGSLEIEWNNAEGGVSWSTVQWRQPDLFKTKKQAVEEAKRRIRVKIKTLESKLDDLEKLPAGRN